MVQALNPKHASVLLVEDSPNDQAIATRALKNFGIRHWHFARTAEDALKEAQKQHYDVVLVDYSLPGMNGLQFVEHLRGVSPDTRVIVVTGVRQESVAIAAMKLGVADYISKDEFLTSGITRSLQAALRDRVATADAEQRGELASRERELQTATIGVVDSYDAMTTDRPYRAALETEEAIQRLQDGAGSQWDPELVAIFVELTKKDDSVGRPEELDRAA